MSDLMKTVFNRVVICAEEYDDLHRQIDELARQRDNAMEALDYVSQRLELKIEELKSSNEFRKNLGKTLVEKINEAG